MNRLGRLGIAMIAATMLAAPALACSIAPPPPVPALPAGTPAADVAAVSQAWSSAHALRRAEEDRAWKLKQQERLFDDAKAIVLVRYDREGKENGEPVAIVKPVRWLKGAKAAGELKIGTSMPPPCGQMTAHDVFYGKAGDVSLVYLSGGKLRQEDVLAGYSLERIIEPRTLALLTAQ
jgi:hypothetical protein